ncbi:bifunctional diguanylate cyclase/phosphodiesterase [Actinoplanes sp. NPDC051411]|uniref:putative bifunctional diguanylate cyclase/phosphodiesterase n=1 Tax=Actinoplanes sp. NPDC051411 TaxID=3155522 RepID=UPI003432DD2E
MRSTTTRRRTPRWMTWTLAGLLALLSGYAVLGSWRQSQLIQRISLDASNTDLAQDANYQAVRELSLIQAALIEPDGDEEQRLPAAEDQVTAAVDRLLAADTDHRSRIQIIADRHARLRVAIATYSGQLDRFDLAAAHVTLETAIEPLTSVITNDLLDEQNEHVAAYARNQASARSDSRWLAGGSLVIFALGLCLLALFGWSNRAHRRLVERMATTDALTGLPNRSAFGAAVEIALAHGRPTVLAANLDGFHDVNDRLGHHVGDLLLVEVGRRLAASVRERDAVARLGGDEFGVLLPAGDPQAGAILAARLIEAFNEPFLIGEVIIDLEVSIGAAAATPDTDVTTLLRQADIALHTAKEQRLGFHLYAAADCPDTAARLTLLGDLRRALEVDDQIALHYQPKIDVSTEAVVGVEALARWQHPERGPIPPGEFIPMLETTSLIHRFTDRVLGIALEQARAWLDAGHRVPVAVNVSTRSLLDTSFPDRVAQLLSDTEVPGAMLCIEITEHTVMSDPATTIEALRRIRALGVKTSIDDYGTGYSSMTYLKLLPLDELKIDRSFVHDMAIDHANRALVRSTVELGRNLGLTVVAEGVEDAETHVALQAVGCDLAQGYHFARPLPGDVLTARLGRTSSALPVAP